MYIYGFVVATPQLVCVAAVVLLADGTPANDPALLERKRYNIMMVIRSIRSILVAGHEFWWCAAPTSHIDALNPPAGPLT